MIDWNAIHRLRFVEQPGCWQTCGGFCCKLNSPQFSFNFLKPNSAGMIFFEEEFQFLKDSGRLQKGFEELSQEWSFEFAPGLSLRFVQSRCSLQGHCSIPDYRPLCCKLYPFLPRFDLKTSEITGFVSGLVVDQLWGPLALTNPCTLARDKAEEVQEQMSPALWTLSQHPYLLFYLKSAELFLDSVATGIERLRQQRPELSSQAFSAEWEYSYLRGEAFDAEKLRASISEEYGILRTRFPDFSV